MTANIATGQTPEHLEKFKQLEPDIWLGILDRNNSSPSIDIDTISYQELPEYPDFRGTVVEALKWTDNRGENILVQTITGHFRYKEYNKDSSEFSTEDKWALYAYLFQKSPGEKVFKTSWKVYDYITCFGVDWYAGFIPQATTITDVNNNGIAEVSMPYVLICRGGLDPGTMKIILYEGNEKYALRGSTMVMCETDQPFGGDYKASDNLKGQEAFLKFLVKRWNEHKCERERFY